MAEDEWALVPDQHQRTIIHIDVDCFYAQVEMVRDPSLREKPLGIKQKNLMVTCNYVARSMGVKKSMWIKDALKILPSLVLVDGSDLIHYRHFSSDISSVAQTFTPCVERLGLDENYVDISDIVGEYMTAECKEHEGHVFGDKEQSNKVFNDPCGCGCFARLNAGTRIAKKLRQQIFETTGITCCAGVAHNKLLAKLISGYHKPNQQTVVYPWQVYDVMNSLDKARSIPGIGSTTFKTLEDLGISTVEELQNASLSLLYSRFDKDISRRLKDLSYGIDELPVKKSGRPQSIGLEDAFKKVNSVDDVQIRYCTLLERLLKLLAEDGRTPGALKVTVRKFHKELRFGQRETKQVPVSPSLFSGMKTNPDKNKTELMNMIMTLFHKMVDTSKDFHLTLIGIGLTKFIERAPEGKAISDFFSKCSREKIDNKNNQKTNKLEMGITIPVPQKFSHNTNNISEITNKNIVPLDVRLEEEDLSPEELSDGEDFHKPVEDMLTEKNFHDKFDNSGEVIGEGSSECLLDKEKSESISKQVLDIPKGIDRDVFDSLPVDLQLEILKSYQEKADDCEEKNNVDVSMTEKNESSKGNPCRKRGLDSFLKKQNNESIVNSKRIKMEENNVNLKELKDFKENAFNFEQPSCSKDDTHSKYLQEESCTKKVNGIGMTSKNDIAHSEVLLKRGIDPEVFNSLPKDLQDEILNEEVIKKPTTSPKVNKRTQSKNPNKSSSILKYFKKK